VFGERANHLHNKPSRTTFRIRLDEMVHALRNDIVTGRLKTGQFIPSITQLSEQYSLSINSVQKGLNQLASESLIEKIPRVGIRVASPGARDGVSITVGCYPSLMKEMELAAIIEQFQEEYPHIRVQTLPLQYANYYEATKYYLENALVDAITINHIHFIDFERRHSELAELLVPALPASGIYPFLQDQFAQNGEPFAQPLIFSPVILCYNKQHLAQKNMPEPSLDWTWHDFMAYLEQLENGEEARIGFYFYPPNYNRWPIFLLQSGAPLPKGSENEFDLGSAPVMDGIQACYDLIHRQKIGAILLSDNDINVEGLFAEQKISMMMTTYFNMNKLRGEVDFPFGIAPLPYVHTPKTLLATVGMAVNQRSKQQEAARAFSDFAASYKSQLHIRRHTFSIPALQEAAEWQGKESGYRPDNYALFQSIAPTFSQLSDLRLSIQESEALLNAMNMYWMDVADKDETFARVSKIIGPSEG